MGPWRICIASLDLLPSRSSGWPSTVNLVRGLRDRGHDVTVVTSRRARYRPTRSWRVSRAPRAHPTADWIGFAYQRGRAIARLERAQPFDVVHFLDVHFAYGLWRPVRCQPLPVVPPTGDERWRAALPRQPQGPHRPDHLLPRGALAGRGAGLAPRRAAAGREPGHGGRVRDALWRRPSAHHPRTAGHRPRALLPARCDALRSAWAGRRPLLLYVGFCTPRKGLDVLARALPSSRQRCASWWSAADAAYRAKFYHAIGPARTR